MALRWLASLMLGLILLLGGCVTTNAIYIGGKTYPPQVSDHPIDVYVPVEAPVSLQQQIEHRQLSALPAYAIRIGRVDAEASSGSSWQSLVDQAKKTARKLGGDGIVVMAWGYPWAGYDTSYQPYYDQYLGFYVVRYNP